MIGHHGPRHSDGRKRVGRRVGVADVVLEAAVRGTGIRDVTVIHLLDGQDVAVSRKERGVNDELKATAFRDAFANISVPLTVRGQRGGGDQRTTKTPRVRKRDG